MSVAEQIFVKAQALPEPEQKTILDLVERLVKETTLARKIETVGKTGHVRLPLIDSKEPGVLNLTNADIEELLT